MERKIKKGVKIVLSKALLTSKSNGSELGFSDGVAVGDFVGSKLMVARRVMS